MTTPTKTEGKCICIALPTFTGQGHYRTFWSLLEGVVDLMNRGITFTWLFREHDSMIARARSLMVAQFLRGENYKHCTHLLFIDSDLAWSFGDLGRFCSHDVDVVGGAYPFKRDESGFPMRWLPGTPDDPPRVNGLYEVEALPPGFLLMSRAALEKMEREYPDLMCQDPLKEAPDGRLSMLFENVRKPDGIWDEGYIFCERWRALGGKVWCDPDIAFIHLGTQRWSGKLSDFMAQRIKAKEGDARFKAALASIEQSLNEMSLMEPIAMPIGYTCH